jgi:hypothetical protein
MNLSFIEVLQVLISGFGSGITYFRTFTDAKKNLDAVHLLNRNGSRLSIALKNLRVEGIILICQLTLFVIGLWTLFIAPPPYLAEGLVDPFGFQTSDEVWALVSDYYRAIQAGQAAMTLVSIYLIWLSHRNASSLDEINQQRRDDKELKELTDANPHRDDLQPSTEVHGSKGSAGSDPQPDDPGDVATGRLVGPGGRDPVV